MNQGGHLDWLPLVSLLPVFYSSPQRIPITTAAGHQFILQRRAGAKKHQHAEKPRGSLLQWRCLLATHKATWHRGVFGHQQKADLRGDAESQHQEATKKLNTHHTRARSAGSEPKAESQNSRSHQKPEESVAKRPIVRCTSPRFRCTWAREALAPSRVPAA